MDDTTASSSPDSSPDSSSTPSAGTEALEKNVRTVAMLCHLLALIGVFVPVVVANILGPLVLWLIKKEDHPFIDDQGKESLNFQITVSIAVAVCAILFFLVIPIFLAIAILILDLIFVIIAAVKANNGERYRYPFAFRFLK